MSDYFETVKPTYIENWPNAVHRLSIVSKDISLTLEDARALGQNIVDYGEGFFDSAPGTVGSIDHIRAKVRDALRTFPGESGFVRLGSRSPKDSWEGHRTGFKITAVDADPLRLLLDSSERIADDLRLALSEKYAPTLFVREWMDIEPWQEWRCFMRDRKMVGISQYSYLDGKIAQCGEFQDSVKWAIEQFFPRFVKASHLDSVVFDVIVKRKERVRHDGILGVEWQVKLLEINPFFEFTDPCLFSWKKGGDFDGSIRICGKLEERK